ncbi:MAG TPA: hypothetical protein VN843_23500, partial [Anaerolineales bacterium]|nr:hypothetical protein [Anaerolineales bacterium]
LIVVHPEGEVIYKHNLIRSYRDFAKLKSVVNIDSGATAVVEVFLEVCSWRFPLAQFRRLHSRIQLLKFGP